MLLSMPVNSILDISPSPLKWHKDFSLGFNSLNSRVSRQPAVSCWGWEVTNNFCRIFIPRVLTSENISGTYLDYSSSEFEGGEASSSYQVTSDDRVLRWADHQANRGRAQGGGGWGGMGAMQGWQYFKSAAAGGGEKSIHFWGKSINIL